MRRSNWITVRFLAVIALVAGLMIPTLLVNVVITDREDHYRWALDDIASSWAARQLIAGPMLAIPYVPVSVDGAAENPSLILIMPEVLDAEIGSTHEYRRRGIFEAPVLTAQVKLSGRFAPIQMDDLGAGFGPPKPSQAALMISVSDARGLTAATMSWNGIDVEPSGASGLGPMRDGFFAPVSQFDYRSGGGFTVTLSLRFVERLGILLIGDRSKLSMTSDWPHPSFNGRILPDSHTITKDGFQADWNSIALARGYQSIIDSRHFGRSVEDGESVGFSVFEPVTLYTLVARTLKYGVMFIVLTLMSVLCLELVSRIRLHIVQYGVVGIGLVLFFLVLLSLTEHVIFDLAYVLATCVLTAMISGYMWLVTRDGTATVVVGALLILLYGSLYAILQLEQYSLLLGTVLLLGLLGAMMLATRGIHRETTPIEPNG